MAPMELDCDVDSAIYRQTFYIPFIFVSPLLFLDLHSGIFFGKKYVYLWTIVITVGKHA